MKKTALIFSDGATSEYMVWLNNDATQVVRQPNGKRRPSAKSEPLGVHVQKRDCGFFDGFYYKLMSKRVEGIL